MAFDCTLMAPHGGIFVFPVVGNPLMYLAALAVGTVVGALMLGVLKKKNSRVNQNFIIKLFLRKTAVTLKL